MTKTYDLNENGSASGACIVSVNISPGGVPKRPVAEGRVEERGLVGDEHAHEKHIRPDRAISLLDVETIRQLVSEGYPLEPGTAGENLTVEGFALQELPPGTRLEIGDVVLKLEKPRKPCFVLKEIHPDLEDAIRGRCGYMASVVRGGTIAAGQSIRTFEPDEALNSS